MSQCGTINNVGTENSCDRVQREDIDYGDYSQNYF